MLPGMAPGPGPWGKPAARQNIPRGGSGRGSARSHPQWREMIEDPQTKIGRPRQIYTGATERDYVDFSAR